MLRAGVRPGERDHLITFIRPVITDGSSNEDKVTGWQTLDYDYARVTNKLGVEVVQGDQIAHLRQSIFNVRYRTDIKTNMQIIHNNLIFAIMSIAESGQTRNTSIDIVCELTNSVYGLPQDLPFDL